MEQTYAIKYIPRYSDSFHDIKHLHPYVNSFRGENEVLVLPKFQEEVHIHSSIGFLLTLAKIASNDPKFADFGNKMLAGTVNVFETGDWKQSERNFEQYKEQDIYDTWRLVK